MFCFCYAVVLGNVLNKIYIKKILTHYELITAVFYSPKRPQKPLKPRTDLSDLQCKISTFEMVLEP